MKIIDCNFTDHGDSILAIFNYAIQNSTAIYAYEDYNQDFIEQWFEAKHAANYPVLGMVDDESDSESGSTELLGFASYGSFRAKPAYKYVVEHSVYVGNGHQGKGVGSLLLSGLIQRAEQQDYHVLIGAVDAENSSSIALHEKFGFTKAGTLNQVGFKFDRWLDLSLYQLILKTPEHPVGGNS